MIIVLPSPCVSYKSLNDNALDHDQRAYVVIVVTAKSGHLHIRTEKKKRAEGPAKLLFN